MKNKIKVWYDPASKWFQAYTPDGCMISDTCKITVSDEFPEKGTRAIIEASVEVVNEVPEKNKPGQIKLMASYIETLQCEISEKEAIIENLKRELKQSLVRGREYLQQLQECAQPVRTLPILSITVKELNQKAVEVLNATKDALRGQYNVVMLVDEAPTHTKFEIIK